jgi:hypothetical protein
MKRKYSFLVAFVLTLITAGAWAKGPCPTQENQAELYSETITTSDQAKLHIQKLTDLRGCTQASEYQEIADHLNERAREFEALATEESATSTRKRLSASTTELAAMMADDSGGSKAVARLYTRGATTVLQRFNKIMYNRMLGLDSAAGAQ